MTWKVTTTASDGTASETVHNELKAAIETRREAIGRGVTAEITNEEGKPVDLAPDAGP